MLVKCEAQFLDLLLYEGIYRQMQVNMCANEAGLAVNSTVFFLCITNNCEQSEGY